MDMPFTEGNMRQIRGDIFRLAKRRDQALVITTNGCIKKNGHAVMGKGIALTAVQLFPGIDLQLAKNLRTNGNHAAYLGWYKNPWIPDAAGSHVLSMPTKDDWQRPSEPSLIERSARELKALADQYHFNDIFMPRPGCGCGNLGWDDVEQILLPILDERFVICTP